VSKLFLIQINIVNSRGNDFTYPQTCAIGKREQCMMFYIIGCLQKRANFLSRQHFWKFVRFFGCRIISSSRNPLIGFLAKTV